jgi:hypothetical protein
MMKQTGIESADPPLRSTGQGLSRWSHHRTYTVSNQYSSGNARHGGSRIVSRSRHVRNSEELQTSIWPRDSPNPILFAPYTMSFSANGPTLHRRATRAGTNRKDTDHDRAYDAQARGRDGETQIGRHGALCYQDHRRCGSSPTHWREQIALHAPSAVIGTYDSIRRPRKQYADFVIVTIHQLMDSASKSPLRMNRLCYDEAHVLAAKITKLQSQYHIPSNADHLWPSRLRLHMPSTYLRTSETSQRCFVFRQTPCAAKYYPDTSTPFGR